MSTDRVTGNPATEDVEGEGLARSYAERQSKPFAPNVDPAQAREAKERLIRAIFGEQTEEDVLREAKEMCEEEPPCEVCMAIARDGAHSDWLRLREAEVAAKALREAAVEWAADPDAVGDSFADARNWLRDRANSIEATQ